MQDTLLSPPGSPAAAATGEDVEAGAETEAPRGGPAHTKHTLLALAFVVCSIGLAVGLVVGLRYARLH